MNIDINKIDIEKLRQDLINEYYAIAFTVSPVALMDISEIENADANKLIQIALNSGFDLNNYLVKTR